MADVENNQKQSTSNQDTAGDGGSEERGVTSPTFTQDQMDAAVKAAAERAAKDAAQKARDDEKTKLYAKLEADKRARDGAEQELAAERAKAEQLAAKLRDAEDTSLTEQERLDKRLKELEQGKAQLENQLNAVATTAAQEIVKHKLDTYKERRMREAAVLPEFADQVTGDSAEQIDLAIADAKAREQRIAETIEKRVREEMKTKLPKPLAPAPEPSSGTDRVIDPRKKREISKLSKDDYSTTRNRLLQKAREQVGW